MTNMPEGFYAMNRCDDQTPHDHHMHGGEESGTRKMYCPGVATWNPVDGPHTKATDDGGNPYCIECSNAIKAWVAYPCRDWLDYAIPQTPPPTQAEMVKGHLFEISLRSWGVSRVVGDPTYTQDDWTLPPKPVYVRAWSLKEALNKATELPLHVWFDEKDEDD